jgi:hypothetical protein
LRRPFRPLQIMSVLAAVLPIVRKSLRCSRSAERAGRLPISAKINLAKSGERLHANPGPNPRTALSASQRPIKRSTDGKIEKTQI